MADPTQPNLSEGFPEPVHTDNRHSVSNWIKKSIEEGRLRDCFNLYIQDYRNIEEGGLDGTKTYTFFLPCCRQQSFVTRFIGRSNEDHAQALRFGLQVNPLSCPKDCTYYRSRRWSEFKHKAGKPFKNAFEWLLVVLRAYTGLPWQTQVAIIGVPVLIGVFMWAPQWVPALVALVQAIRGK